MLDNFTKLKNIEQASRTFQKAFPAVKNPLPGSEARETMNTTNNSFRKSRNTFMEQRNSEHASLSTGTRTNKNFGFRNHSLPLGSTVRHFSTMSDFPKIKSKGERARSNMNPTDSQRETVRSVPRIMESLRHDPKALEIFIEELALADQSQPKHLKFFNNLPETTLGGIGLGASPRIASTRKDSLKVAQ